MSRFARLLIIALLSSMAGAQHANTNAALVYWSAIGQMKDFSLTDEQAHQLVDIVHGIRPYDDSQFSPLLQENRDALDTLARGTRLPNCDWGIESNLGPSTPVEYVRKARVIGHLNLLYALHLSSRGHVDAAAETIAAGVRFSHDVAQGGTLLSALTAAALMRAHLAIAESLLPKFDSAGKQGILSALSQAGAEGFDWQANLASEMQQTKADLDLLRTSKDPRATYKAWLGEDAPASFHTPVAQDDAAVDRISKALQAYVAGTGSQATVQSAIKDASPLVQRLIPNPARIASAHTELENAIMKAKSEL